MTLSGKKDWIFNLNLGITAFEFRKHLRLGFGSALSIICSPLLYYKHLSITTELILKGFGRVGGVKAKAENLATRWHVTLRNIFSRIMWASEYRL